MATDKRSISLSQDLMELQSRYNALVHEKTFWKEMSRKAESSLKESESAIATLLEVLKQQELAIEALTIIVEENAKTA